ncbi:MULTISPECIES: NAD(+) diphosphatase [Actinomyces]|uniref:NAD(+) diphosphatase n=1 Tax=Actinomyces respiraculi TaxID=2744574 RepID=A0A7T0PXM7_9ACTO|nr:MULTISPECIES: NAD(+) diphosphatase [Actinomyces]QPL06005.1 NAD(+) diphosphatase [Actinomyces respiraculi]
MTAALLDRDAARRARPGLLQALAEDPSTRLVVVDARGRVSLDAPGQGADLPQDGLTPTHGRSAGQVLELAPVTAADLDLTGLETYYLGRQESDATSWLAVVVPDETTEPPDAEGAAHPHVDLDSLLARFPLSALRAVGADLSACALSLTTPAVALAAWHASHHYCPACGARTVQAEAGWAQRCTGCGRMSFPRTDPAVIMSVTDEQDRIILVHGSTWEAGRYSTIAGFIEAGESAEAAVVREVAEETGLRVSRVEQVATQPWPFPRSLMLGYRAWLEPGQSAARPDGTEVTDVRVLSRAELAAAVDSGRLVLPGAASIARRLIEDWFGGPLGR